MDMEGALMARLLAASAVTDIVGTRIYWEQRKQGTRYPAVVLDLISDVRDQTLKDYDLPLARLQARVMASSFEEKKALKEAVIATLIPPALKNGIQFMRGDELSAVPRNEQTDTEFVRVDAISYVFHWKAV